MVRVYVAVLSLLALVLMAGCKKIPPVSKAPSCDIKEELLVMCAEPVKRTGIAFGEALSDKTVNDNELQNCKTRHEFLVKSYNECRTVTEKHNEYINEFNKENADWMK